MMRTPCPGGKSAVGVANGLGDAKTGGAVDDDDADLGSHDLRATWTPTGAATMTS